ncbi:predicted protein [Uncinocarpus reesii 1704]|uniref:Uncharacterized protein n=1 Tax=Uncinocarpus reesii (strain UAMH 1704) TaxID=336963 RepID=C4JU36_UNCRE|nr:uncharacterized protein UREG_05975 [Uncinocarpus reesii 1704]EEP81133.1 predicted protein [Uncinocarpus reesii 1704]
MQNQPKLTPRFGCPFPPQSPQRLRRELRESKGSMTIEQYLGASGLYHSTTVSSPVPYLCSVLLGRKKCEECRKAHRPCVPAPVNKTPQQVIDLCGPIYFNSRFGCVAQGDRDEFQQLVAETNRPAALVRSQRARAAALASVASFSVQTSDRFQFKQSQNT